MIIIDYLNDTILIRIYRKKIIFYLFVNQFSIIVIQVGT